MPGVIVRKVLDLKGKTRDAVKQSHMDVEEMLETFAVMDNSMHLIHRFLEGVKFSSMKRLICKDKLLLKAIKLAFTKFSM